MTGAEGPKPPIPCRTTVPEQTAYSGAPPGAEMSTPSSSDHVPGGEAEPLGNGKLKPPLLGGGPDEPCVGPAPEPALARAAAAACAASCWLSWGRRDTGCPLTASSWPELALRL